MSNYFFLTSWSWNDHLDVLTIFSIENQQDETAPQKESIVLRSARDT